MIENVSLMTLHPSDIGSYSILNGLSEECPIKWYSRGQITGKARIRHNIESL